MQVQSTDMLRGKRGQIAPPIEDIEAYWTPRERPAVEHKLRYTFVGSAETVRSGIAGLIQQTGADELISTVRIFDPLACLRSLEILASVRDSLASGPPR